LLKRENIHITFTINETFLWLFSNVKHEPSAGILMDHMISCSQLVKSLTIQQAVDVSCSSHW
jgi:hypothetical protein